MVSKSLTVAIALVAACGKKNDGGPAPAVRVPSAARRTFIDETNARPGLGFRVSFGGEDAELLVEFDDGQTPCTEESMNKIAELLREPAQAAGFARLSCKPHPPAEAARPDAAEKPAAPPSATDAPEAADAVTAGRLFADYEENEVSADNKYRGKLLEVTGVIKKISKDFLDKPYVELLTGDRYGLKEVWAYFDDEGLLGKLRKGEKLVLRCRGSGATMSTPMLKSCTLEHIYEWVPAK
jgi:hypothetical protein